MNDISHPMTFLYGRVFQVTVPCVNSTASQSEARQASAEP